MISNLRKILYITAFCFLHALNANAQQIPVGDILEDQIRIQQLLQDTLGYSFTNRSVDMQMYRDYMRGAENQPGWWNQDLSYTEMNLDSHFRLGFYPVELRSTYNSKIPLGGNNGPAWYGRGFNSELQGGAYITSEFVTVSFSPFFGYTQNRNFEVPRYIPQDEDGNVTRYHLRGNDALFRFGDESFSTYNPGHSAIRLHYQKFEIGYSNQALWWGPGVQQALVMSNNAQTIRHSYLGTRSPLQLPFNIGQFEFRWMFGTPEESDYYTHPNAGKERFTNAINITYSPGFLPNLHLGMTRLYHIYKEDGLTRDDYFRIFDPFQKIRIFEEQGGDDERQGRDQIASAYGRWVFPQARAEIYFEFYREDHSRDWRDFMMQPRLNAAHTLGFQKIFDTPYFDFIKMNVEITSLTGSRIAEVRTHTNYYTHSRINHGHTNNGQIIGAWIGSGSNSQYMDLQAYWNQYRAKLFVQRWAEDDEFHYRIGTPSNRPFGDGDYWRHRINFSVGGGFDLISWNKMTVRSALIWTKALNYGRYDYRNFDVDSSTFTPYDLINIQAQVGVRYGW